MNTVEEKTPEPLPVEISFTQCSVHGFRLIGMPRDENGDDLGVISKCPIRGCFANAVWKEREDCR